MVKYSIPTNFQPDLILALAGLPVAELYGQLPRDFVGGGRASSIIGPVSRRQLRRHIQEAHRAGFRFNYTLNAISMANREWSILGQWQLARLVEFLVDCDVDKVTVSLPYLLQYIKRRAPGLKVSVSTQVGVATPDKARRWQDLGADGITLSVVDVNRDFDTLRAIRRAVSIRLQLIANLLCLQGCPATAPHASLTAHASQTGMSRFVVDYCTISCDHHRLSHPEEIIRAGWIRPEDQGIYTDLGIHQLKLVSRGMRTDALVPIVQAYASKQSPANLMDLFPSPDKCHSLTHPGLLHLARHFGHPHRANLFRLRKMKGLSRARQIYLDSGRLEGFLQPFLEGRCKRLTCEECGHCTEVARRTVRFDPKERRRVVRAYKMAQEDILSGRLFSYLPRWWSRPGKKS